MSNSRFDDHVGSGQFSVAYNGVWESMTKLSVATKTKEKL